jgi:hypothetical protein
MSNCQQLICLAPLPIEFIPFSNGLQNNRPQRAQCIHPAFTAALNTDTLQLTGAGRDGQDDLKKQGEESLMSAVTACNDTRIGNIRLGALR